MSREQSFQVLGGGSASRRNDSDHIASAATIPVSVFPVVIPEDTGPTMRSVTGHISLEASSSTSGGEQPAVRRKRGRPRKIKQEDQPQGGRDRNNEATLVDQQPATASMKRGSNSRAARPKRSEQQSTKREDPGVVSPLEAEGEASMPEKRSRGRSKKGTTSSAADTLELEQQPTMLSSRNRAASNDGVTPHASTDIYNAVQQHFQAGAMVMSAIRGTPVQVLPTTAVVTMNTLDSRTSPLLGPAAPVSVVVSPTGDDAAQWTTPSATRLSTATDKKKSLEKAEAFGASIAHRLRGTSTPPLLHAEQPEVLKSLPQCSLSSGEISVKLVDRLAGLKESDSHCSTEEVHHDEHYVKQSDEDTGVRVHVDGKGATIIENVTGSGLVSVE